MAYSTPAEVREVLVAHAEPEDKDVTAAELTDEQLEYAIASADTEIDAYISIQVALPLQLPAPTLIHQLSIDIACYMADLMFFSQQTMSSQAPSQLRYDRARRILENIRSGRMRLPIEDTVASGDYLFNNPESPMFDLRHIFGQDRIPEDRTYY